MTPRQHNAAMIDFRLRAGVDIGCLQTSALDQRPSASRTPVPFRLGAKHRMAIAANAFHR